MDGDQVEKIATSAFDGFERGNSFAEDQEHLDLAGDLIAGLRQGEEPTLDQFVGLGTALAGLSDTVQTIWGSDDIVLWADGECCLITAPTGHGKTTLAQNVLLAMTPLRSSEVLGHEVRQLAEDEFILYLAADRPDQILRSFARMVEPDDYAALDETILVRKGPPEAMIVKDQKQYVKMISKAEEATGKRCAVLVVDSLKDMAPATSEDATGSALNIARQYVVATGRQVLELHHQRKKQQGGGPPNTIDDVFGSSHIVNGAGTVLLIWASETTGLVDRLPVEVKTLKKPMAPFRCQAVIDAPSGTITPTDDRSAKDLFVGPTASVTAEQVARHLGVTTKTAQRRLRDLVTEGFAREVPGSKGGAGGSSAITWVRDTSKGVK